jgi:two-component system, LytTR family, sensor kinase
MPDWLSIHEPILVNTIGHCGGAVIFGMLLYFFLANWRRGREERAKLPVLAAALAFLWNIGSLVALGTGPRGGMAPDIIVAASFSVLSLLPAVLLHISLGTNPGLETNPSLESHRRPILRLIWISGYVLSSGAILLHLADLVTGRPSLHFAALLLVTIGFAVLTAISVLFELRRKNRAATSRLVGAMVLFLFAISFTHFGAEHGHQVWSKEIALHHAGIPLALFVLLQNYRFLLLDAFLRFVVNATLAAAAVLASIRIVESVDHGSLRTHPFDAGLLFAGGCLLLTLFVYVRNRVQSWLTSVVFLRSNVDAALEQLLKLARAAQDESVYLPLAVEVLAAFVRTARFELTEQAPHDDNLPAWVQAAVPLRFSRGDIRYLLLGPREGGRRYLSEDFAVLMRLGAAVVEHVEQLRGIQMQGLVSQAELKALQAQINPHFFFNALNTLYGTIDRANADARRLVLNLSDVFRYLLRSDRTMIEIEEELRIVRAYLEIEQLRLGAKLRTEINVDEAALRAMIPLLSVQPLVENAVKHGIAGLVDGGTIRLEAHCSDGLLRLKICNEFDPESPAASRHGLGLRNVRDRLRAIYENSARVDTTATSNHFVVELEIPCAEHV